MAEETTTTEKVRVSFYNKNNPQPNIQSNYSQEDENANDYIKNKPGGYYIDFPEIDIVWDGVVGDKEVVSSGDVDYIKVSTDTMSVEQLVGGILTATQSSGEGSSSSTQTQSVEIKSESIKEYYDGVYLICGSMFVVTKDSVSLNDLSFTRGIYFMKRQVSNRNMYMSRFYCPSKKTVKKIPASFVDLKGGYDTETVSTELYNGNFSADDFVDVSINDSINTTKCVILQLKKAPQQGNRISGTINGVNVHGTYQSSYVELKADNSSNQYDYVIAYTKGNYVFLSYDAENNPDTYVPTDLSINLSLTVMSEPVKIPEEYLDTSSIDSSIENINNNIEKIKNQTSSSIIGTTAPTSSTVGTVGQMYYVINNSQLNESYICSSISGSISSPKYTWIQTYKKRRYPKTPQITYTVTEDNKNNEIYFSKDDNGIDLDEYCYLYAFIKSPEGTRDLSANLSRVEIILYNGLAVMSENDFLNKSKQSFFCFINCIDKFAIANNDSFIVDAGESSQGFSANAIVGLQNFGLVLNNVINTVSTINIWTPSHQGLPVGTSIKIWLK